ncbi:hypothetical protein [Streptomyces sp. G-G2]|uniref:hypothetical protein n=1 Tax=Streptomyces sp. G-G2 TaxID=3046201 RepID=UPI0024BAC926|nr:hypothetical protein [Streptomyces sp. G-G2]MDJ0385913.1 hypothetical protein [Streptomyces sp. G-G2]
MSATQAALTQLLPLAGDTFDKNKVTPGLLGFIVFAALAIGVWGLMKSMSRHMGRVTFEEAPDPAAAAGSGSGTGTGSGAPEAPRAAS